LWTGWVYEARNDELDLGCDGTQTVPLTVTTPTFSGTDAGMTNGDLNDLRADRLDVV
jgi:hypothetical protein